MCADAFQVLLLVLSVGAGQAGAPIRPTPCPQLQDIELDIAAAEARARDSGRSQSIQRTVAFAGFLHVFALAQNEADLALRIERSDGTVVAEDDDSGGGTIPCVRIEVQPGPSFTIVVTAKSDAGRAVVHMAAAPETERSPR